MILRIAIVLLITLPPYSVWAQSSNKKALFIIVDGIPTDVVEKVNTPNLDEIAKVGGFTHAYMGGQRDGYSQTPTISAVGYNSLLTGTWVNKHNVWGNGIKDPNYHYWTIFRFLEEQYPEKRTAIFSTWLDNRTKLIGDGLPQTDYLLLDYHFDGFELDTINFPHEADRKFIHLIDEDVVNEAARYVKAYAPDLSWVYLEFTDDMGHKFGDSSQMYDAVEVADDQIGRIWSAIKYREDNFDEDWLIVITTDHGRDAETGKNHGGQSERERTIWITTNANGLNPYFKEEKPGMVSIFPTLAHHLELDIPKPQAMELDGIPLTGDISLANPQASLAGKKINLTWDAMEKDGEIKIWLSTTNHFKEGKEDNYELVAEVPLTKEAYSFEIDETSPIYKIVLEGKNNMVNRWVVTDEK